MIIEPLTYNDRVYVPVDSILHAMGQNVQWNANTNTLNFGATQETQPPVQAGEPFTQAVPPYDVSPRKAFDSINSHGVRVRDNVPMGGNLYDNAITYSTESLFGVIAAHSLHIGIS